MSQMRETTTINQNQNLDSSAINGFRGSYMVSDYMTARPSTQPQTITKNDRNNNNVMKKSMPPPVPPKRTSSTISSNLSNATIAAIAIATNTGRNQYDAASISNDRRTSIASHISGKSHNNNNNNVGDVDHNGCTVINHVREQNALMNVKNAASNELHNVHCGNDKGTDKNDDGKGNVGEDSEGTNADHDDDNEKEEEGHCATTTTATTTATTVGSIAASGIRCNGDNNNEKLNNVSLNQQRSTANVMRQPSSGTLNGMCS